ncbi:unnamed protein product [Heterobilharzia americana]|nr:unnamed protein product [Heterobilharzia americana]
MSSSLSLLLICVPASQTKVIYRQLYGVFPKVTMTRTEDALLAIRDPNPCIDGRKANVNLAVLGAKPRLLPGTNTAMPAFFPLQTGLPIDASHAGLYNNSAAAVTNSLMNPLMNPGLLTGFNVPSPAGLSPGIGGLLQTPTNHNVSTISDPSTDNRLHAQLSLNPLASLNYLLNYSNATGNSSSITAAAALAGTGNTNQTGISPAALALLMSTYGQGTGGLNTALPTNNSFIGMAPGSQPSLNATSLSTTSLLNLNSTTPNTSSLNALTGSSAVPPFCRTFTPEVSANELNAYSAAIAYQRLLNMASNYQTFPPSLLTPVNPANSLSGALINNSFPSLGQTFNYANSNNNNNTNGNSNNGMNVSADQSSSSMPMVYPSTSRSLVTFAPDMNGTSYDYTNPHKK